MRQRSISFDVLKGIAILLVVLGHVFRSSLRGAPSIIEDVIYSVHMPLFVLVTGFFATRPIEWTLGGVWTFWRAKMLRLLLPLLFIAEVAQIALEGSVSLPLRSMVGGYWFTYALFMIFIVFFATQGVAQICLKCYRLLGVLGGGKKVVGAKSWTIAFLLLSIPLVELLIAYGYGINARLCNGLVLYKVAHLYKYFLLGYLLASYPRLDAYVLREQAGAMGFFAFVLLFIAQHLGYTFVGQEVLMTLSGLIFIYGAVRQAVTQEVEPQRWVRALAYLGRVSLPIYFLHYFFLPDLPLLREYEGHLLGTPIALFAFQGIVGFVMTLLILAPTLLLVQVTRTNRYLRLLLYGEALPKKR